MNKKQLIKQLRSHCKDLKVKVKFRRFTEDCDGLCFTCGTEIHINKNTSKKDIAITTFHELGHVHCIRNNIYKKFHRSDSKKFTPEQVFMYENKVEHIAKQLWDNAGMRKRFGQFSFYYKKSNKKEVIDWIESDL